MPDNKAGTKTKAETERLVEGADFNALSIQSALGKKDLTIGKKIEGMSLGKKGVLLVGILLIVELIFVGMLFFFLYDSEESGRHETEAQTVLSSANRLFMGIVRMSWYEHSFMARYDRVARKGYGRQAPIVYGQMEDLVKVSRNNPTYSKSVDAIVPMFQRWFAWEQRMVKANDNMSPEAGPLRNDPRRPITINMLNALKRIQQDMKPVVAKNAAEHLRAQQTMMQWLIAGMVANVFLAIFMALAFTKQITGRIFIILDNTKRLVAGQPLNQALEQKDEIGLLDNVFHEMSDAVNESSRKERALIENSSEVICTLNADGRFIKVNPAVSEKWSYEPENLFDRKAADLILDEERQTFNDAISRSKDSESGAEFEARLKGNDGNIIDSVWTVHWSEADACFFAVVHDMTERKKLELAQKESEARVRTVLNSMLVGLLTVSDEGLIESANPRVEQMFLYNADAIVGQPLSLLFPDSVLSNFPKFIQSASEKSHNRSEENLHIHLRDFSGMREDNESLPVELWVNEMRGEHKSRFLINIVDNTARRQIEQAKEEFVAMISHDLKTPLAAVQGFLELLENGVYGNLKATGLDRAKLARRNVRSLLRLIMDLLEISKLESGNIELRKQEMDMKDVVERSVEAVQGFAQKHQVSLEALSESVKLIADGERLDRVLINLMSNAVKYSPTSGTVKIVMEDGAEFVKLSVIDRGRGIPASHKDLVFERFKQVTATDATQKGGAGLGLAICKAIVEQHGGTIGVDSVEGEGSTFWFTVPKEQAPS